LIIVIIEILLGFSIGAVGVLYTILKVNDPKTIALFWIITTILIIIIGVFGDISHQTGSKMVNEPFSQSLWYFWILPLIEGVWFTSLIKIFIVINKKARTQ